MELEPCCLLPDLVSTRSISMIPRRIVYMESRWYLLIGCRPCEGFSTILSTFKFPANLFCSLYLSIILYPQCCAIASQLCQRSVAGPPTLPIVYCSPCMILSIYHGSYITGFLINSCAPKYTPQFSIFFCSFDFLKAVFYIWVCREKNC